MIIGGRRRISGLLFAGDILAFVVALYLTLWVRYLEPPTGLLLTPYVVPFTLLFLVWTLVFYSAGLYSKRLLLFPNRLPDALLKTQAVNILFTGAFFLFFPSFGLTPRAVLLLYFVISFATIYLWRLTLFPRLTLHTARLRAVLLARGEEAEELYHEVNSNPRYGLEFYSRSFDASADLIVADKEEGAENIPARLNADTQRLISFEELYEEVFDRIPLSRLKDAWFLDRESEEDSLWYRVAKRVFDIVGGIAMGVVTLLIAPFVFIANRFEGSGPLWIVQERLGKGGARIRAYKFRSMQKNLAASGEWIGEGENRVTRVGAFLRKTSLDEFPQCINVLKGELSLIGPRNDILGLGKRLAESLPYYMRRYAVVPGITGWAQINQQYEPGHVSPQSIEETKVRLAYDFYYLKHRSFGLDLIIALKTIKRMFFRVSAW